MRLIPVALGLALLTTAGAARADRGCDPASYRAAGALGCGELRTELLQVERELSALSQAELRLPRAEPAGRPLGASSLALVGGLSGATTHRAAGTFAAERDRLAAARQRAAERRLRRAQTRRSLLVGLYLARHCADADRPRPGPSRPPAPALYGDAD